MDRIFEPSMLLGIFGGAIIASALGFAAGLAYQPATAAKRAGEAWLVALLGGFLANAFVVVLLEAGDNSEGTAMLVGWFLGFPGLFDTILFPLRGVLFFPDGPLFTRPQVLITWAAVVGTLAGGLHGAYRMYKWNGLGVFQFVADVTWGLLGTTLGTLLNLYNSLSPKGRRLLPRTWQEGEKGERLGVTVFEEGFHTAHALTQGSTISNVPYAELYVPGTTIESPLLQHERTHVFQNRAFGPFFTLTYAAWMALWFVPALIADRIASPNPAAAPAPLPAPTGPGIPPPPLPGATAGTRPTKPPNRVWGWCYFSNPWEVWGYHVQRENRERYETSSWSTPLALGIAVPFYGLIALFMAGILSKTLFALRASADRGARRVPARSTSRAAGYSRPRRPRRELIPSLR